MFRSLFSFTTHAVLISTALAGVQRTSGYNFRSDAISIAGLRKIFEGFLDLGNYCLDYAIDYVKTSNFFVKAINK